jgi:phosphoglycolate phosphatase-like HAD superfamily hydrolase
MAATKLDEALLIELGISDDRLTRQLARAYDKAIRDSRKLEAEFNRVTNGAVTRMGNGFERMGMDAQRSMRQASSGVAGLGAAMNSARPQIQNAAFQIGDFATQLAGGTRASTALAQQLPQLLGGFGAIGAVLGAGVAIGIPLFASALGQTAEEAVTLEAALEELSQQVSDYSKAVENANLSTEELIEKYGRLADAGQRVSEALAAAALAETVEAISQAVESAAGAFANTEVLVAALSNARARSGGDVAQMRQEIEALAENLGVTEMVARDVVLALNALANAEGIRAQSEAAEAVLAAMVAALGPIEGMEGAALDLARQMATLADLTAQVGGNTGQMYTHLQMAAAGAGTFASAISAAQGPASVLLGQVQAIAQSAWDAAQNMALAASRQRIIDSATATGGGRGGDPRTMGGSAYDWTNRDAILWMERQSSMGSGRSGSGRSGSGRSGGASAASQQPEWWDELVEKVREGEQAFEDYRAEVERGADALQDFFTSILDGSKSAKEALADLLRQLAEVQLRKALLGLGESGGWVGQAFSSLGQALSFDGGGYTGAGARSGGIDGRGGFPAILHPNETVIDHSRGQSGGGGQVSVVVRMEGGNLVPVIESVSGSVTARAMQAYDRQLPLRVRQIGGDRRAI